jgi:diadenosine tetraphosphate (Ap4A) HIT family hydrolase
MFTYPETPASSEGPAEIGPPPYYHRSDCNICRQQDGEMTTSESAELGSILHRLVPAVKVATGVERVYYLALMEKVAHFHLWLVPRKDQGELRGVLYLAQQPPLTASYSGAEAMSQKIRAELDPS